jgi:hypothetical protein
MAYQFKQGAAPLLDAALNRVDGAWPVNKFGRAPFGVQTSATDIWDRADAVPTQQIWVAPTTARKHDIASTSGLDTDGGDGARTIKIFGLTSWGTNEVSETLTMDGTNDVETNNAYVIIHRAFVVTDGSTSGPNAGTITGTAQTDGSITFVIRPSEGQTQMAIYGVPSCCRLAIYQLTGSMLRGVGTGVGVDVSLLVNTDPENTTSYIIKETDALLSAGTSALPRVFTPPKMVDGPAIVKIQCVATTTDVDFSASFDAVLVDV